MATVHDGPFFTGDGQRTFFHILPPERGLLNTYAMLREARKYAARIRPRAEGRARALAIDVAMRDLQRRIDGAAARTAFEAEKLIVSNIRGTQVRPDPPGKSAGRRLQESIECRPILRPSGFGAVGIGDVAVLDRASDYKGRPYWRAQEFGSSHLVGTGVAGTFEPGFSAPDPNLFRVHPIFVVRRGGYPMIIQRPIPERAFLRNGGEAADVLRQRLMGAAASVATTELRLIQAGTHSRLRSTRAYLRDRRQP